jgi:hypothetical protein
VILERKSAKSNSKNYKAFLQHATKIYWLKSYKSVNLIFYRTR